MIKSSSELVEQANKEINTISIDEAKKLHGRDDVIFIDLRDIRELDKEGRISGAMHAPRGMIEFWIDPASLYHRKEFSSGKKLVFFCAAAWRSALTVKTVKDMGLKNICHIEGGFGAWREQGGEVEQAILEQDKFSRQKKISQGLLELKQSNRLISQISFILEIDKLKQIIRQTKLLDKSRRENDAEHSWQLAMMALVLKEYAPKEMDILRVLKMLLIHDIVEIDAGDNPAFSQTSNEQQYEKEQIAAERLFGILPEETEQEFLVLWQEFEDMNSIDAVFARSMDRLQPFLHNYFNDGEMWLGYDISVAQVQKRMAVVEKASAPLHQLVQDIIEESADRGYLLS